MLQQKMIISKKKGRQSHLVTQTGKKDTRNKRTKKKIQLQHICFRSFYVSTTRSNMQMIEISQQKKVS